jgi:diaminopimelate decarboxylase
MIISSEHHNLLEQFIAANKAEGVAIKALHDYITTQNYDRDVAVTLTKQMEEACNNASKLYHQLQSVSLKH